MRTLEELFWPKVTAPNDNGCMLWTASLNQKGYGQFMHRRKMFKAHRLAYELKVGPIPEGLHIDHLCRVRNCVTPEHLEAVTPGENSRRGVSHWGARNACSRGHLYEDERPYVARNGSRQCNACRRERYAEER
jgi:hypothetical protein